MTKATTIETHERRHAIVIDHKQLEAMVASAACDLIPSDKPRIGRRGVSYKVTFEEALEGSPGYRVGYKAVVAITEDLMPQTTEEPNP